MSYNYYDLHHCKFGCGYRYFARDGDLSSLRTHEEYCEKNPATTKEAKNRMLSPEEIEANMKKEVEGKKKFADWSHIEKQKKADPDDWTSIFTGWS